jgi:hypothetical protein
MGMARASRPLLMALKPAPNREHCVERVGASGIVNGVVRYGPARNVKGRLNNARIGTDAVIYPAWS